MNREQIEQEANGRYPDNTFAYNGFVVGAEWLINSVWHDAETTPSENSEIVLIDQYGDWYNISYSFDKYEDMFGKGWESCVREYEIDKWAYLDDLLPMKGERQ